MNRLAQAFGGMPLRWKVIVSMLGVTAISLLLVGAGLLVRERQAFERQMEQRLTLLADVMGLNSTAALAFNDPLAATETLGALESDKHVMAGALYDARHRLFAHYLRSDVDRELPDTAPAVGPPVFADETAAIARTIKLKGQPVGRLYLLADTTEWHNTLWGYAGIIGSLFVVVLAVGLLVSLWLQRLVTGPIIDLVQLMQHMGREHDFSLRAIKRSDDEMGVLVDGFNDMLDEIDKGRAQIERAQDELRKLNEDLEQRVQSRTAQLESANRELEAFSYSVSHDLRAPLRAIDGFSRILLDGHSGALDAEGRDHLERVRRAAQRMGLLIDDLLKLARVTRTEPSREPVDLTVLGREVADVVRNQYPDRHVRFVAEPGMTVHGDPRLLRIALENLLGNAWKFTGARSDASVELGMTHNSAPVYFVRDNGAGFDMKYADKLFAPFQRLHSADEFPGTGIGLATVHRIVQKHGGRIWAEGTVGQGAAFFFTLP